MQIVKTLLASRPAAARLLTTSAAALLMIIGLLAMHSITAVATTSGAASTAEMSAAQPLSSVTDQKIAVGTRADGVACDADCVAVPHSSSPDHSMTMTMEACIAVLFVVLVLMVRGGVPLLHETARRRDVPMRGALARLAAPQPPSLVALSISRI